MQCKLYNAVYSRLQNSQNRYSATWSPDPNPQIVLFKFECWFIWNTLSIQLCSTYSTVQYSLCNRTTLHYSPHWQDTANSMYSTMEFCVLSYTSTVWKMDLFGGITIIAILQLICTQTLIFNLHFTQQFSKQFENVLELTVNVDSLQLSLWLYNVFIMALIIFSADDTMYHNFIMFSTFDHVFVVREFGVIKYSRVYWECRTGNGNALTVRSAAEDAAAPQAVVDWVVLSSECTEWSSVTEAVTVVPEPAADPESSPVCSSSLGSTPFVYGTWHVLYFTQLHC